MCNDCGDDRSEDNVAVTGGITGRANCASNELTTPKLGARTVVTGRVIVLEGVGDGVLLFPEFCSNCFSNTFCEFCVSSDFCGADILENLHPLFASDSVLFPLSSIASFISSLTTSKLCLLMPRICAGASFTKPGGSSVDLERRNGALVN